MFLLILSVAAAVSGAAALVYQINWQRQLTALFRVHHYAVTTIVLVFFLGFAVGASIAQRYVDRFRRPLLFIVALEAIIAVFALVAPSVFSLGERLLGAMYDIGTLPPLVGVVLRAAIAVFLLIVPTVCMGATLPAFYRIAVTSMAEMTRRVGIIVGLNTTGAVAGSVITTFYLMGSYDGVTQMRIAASLNTTVVVLMLLLLFFASDFRRPSGRKAVRFASNDQPRHHDADSRGRLLVAYALTGAAGLGLEIVWTRIVYMSLDQTIYTFSLTLTIYLLGFALGALVSSVLVRRVAITVNRVAAMQTFVLLFSILGA